MDRQSVIGLVLIAAIIIFFSIWNTPRQQELERAKKIADSLELVKKQSTQKNNDSIVNSTNISKIAADTIKKTTNEKSDLFGSFSTAVEGTEDIYSIENNLVKLSVTTKGGRPYSVELKKYKTFSKSPLILFSGDSTQFGFNFFTTNNRHIFTNNLYFKPYSDKKDISVDENDTAKSLKLRLFIDDDKYIEYVYTLRPNQYMIDFKANFVNLDSIISPTTTQLDVYYKIYLRCQEREINTEKTYTSIYYKFNKEKVENLELSKDNEKSLSLPNKLKWIAYKQQFFSNVIIAKSTFDNASITIKDVKDTSTHFLRVCYSEIGVPYQNGKFNSVDLSFYFGPNHYQTLKKYKIDLEDLVTLGSSIVKWINRFLIIPVFNFLNKFISNYGIIILLLTIFIKIILFPLTYKSYLSMAKMRVLKPQIDEINNRIPAEKAMERQQAVMALYKRVGVNPLGGCLPMLLQFPILIAMFRFFPSSIELRQQAFLWAKDLSSYDAVITWSAHIPIITEYFGNHISLFNVLMTVTTIITMKMNNQTNASQQQMPGMQTMMYIMPVFFMFILNRFSAGLTYYYFLTNIISIIQNEIFKRAIDEDKLLKQLNDNKKKPVKKSSFQARLEEAAKKSQYKKR